MGINIVVLNGHIGADIELRDANGTTVGSFPLCNNTYAGKDENGDSKERQCWIYVSVWGKQAEGLAPYLTKGKSVTVHAELTENRWEDADGGKHSRHELRLKTIDLHGGAQNENDAPVRKAAPKATTKTTAKPASKGKRPWEISNDED